MTRVVVHIDKLVMHGGSRADAQMLAAAIQAQLTQSFIEPGAIDAIAGLGDRQRLTVKSSTPVFVHNATAVGGVIAQSIVKGAVR